MGEKRGHQFPFRSHESFIVAVSFASTNQRTRMRSELDFVHVRIVNTGLHRSSQISAGTVQTSVVHSDV